MSPWLQMSSSTVPDSRKKRLKTLETSSVIVDGWKALTLLDVRIIWGFNINVYQSCLSIFKMGSTYFAPAPESIDQKLLILSSSPTAVQKFKLKLHRKTILSTKRQIFYDYPIPIVWKTRLTEYINRSVEVSLRRLDVDEKYQNIPKRRYE